MDSRWKKYDRKRKQETYQNAPGGLFLIDFVLGAALVLCLFLLLAYEPADRWHDTTFVLSDYHYRTTRGGGVLDLYTTDGRRFVLNHNDEVIQHQLVRGRSYKAVYSDDLFHDIIQGLQDSERAYMNAEKRRENHRKERWWFTAVAIGAASVLGITNTVYAVYKIRKGKNRRKYEGRKQL